jgi:hypothetical protein
MTADRQRRNEVAEISIVVIFCALIANPSFEVGMVKYSNAE